jgi:hypothetical protein
LESEGGTERQKKREKLGEGERGRKKQREGTIGRQDVETFLLRPCETTFFDNCLTKRLWKIAKN